MNIVKKVKPGLIGCGSFSKMHLEGLKDQKRAEVVALCDTNRKNLEERAKEFDLEVPLYNSIDEMLSDDNIDAIIIATCDQAHKDITVKALHADKHVLCEKPMTAPHLRTKPHGAQTCSVTL